MVNEPCNPTKYMTVCIIIDYSYSSSMFSTLPAYHDHNLMIYASASLLTYKYHPIKDGSISIVESTMYDAQCWNFQMGRWGRTGGEGR